MTKKETISISLGHRLQWEKAQNSFVLLYPEGMVTLNESSSEILKLCDGTRSEEEIIAVLEKRFPNAAVEEDVYQFLKDAYENGWITGQ